MHVLLIDGLNLIRRVYAAVPQDSDRQGASAAYFESADNAIVQSVKRALSRHRPSHALCVLESQAQTWRHLRYRDYKKNRTPMPAELATGLHRIEASITAAGVRCLSVPGFEADDVIATMAMAIANRRAGNSGSKATILSTDTKFCQILRAGIEVFNHFDNRLLDEAFCLSRFGVPAVKLNDWFGLVGDSALHLPGVPGVGPKTATGLLNDYGDFDGIYNHLDSLKSGLATRLRQNEAEARLTRELTALRQDVEVGVNLRNYRLDAKVL